MGLIFLLMHAKFEGNLITCLHFMAVFCKCAKRRKNKKNEKKKNQQFFECSYLRMAGMIYGMCSLLKCRHLHSEFGLVQTRSHRATDARKISLYFLCSYNQVVHACLVFLSHVLITSLLKPQHISGTYA